jgi:DNA polymerase-3 subunit gamma/tau
MPATDGQLKKKPDTPAVAPVKESTITDEMSVVSDTQATYVTTKTQPINPPAEPEKKEIAAAVEKPKVFIPNSNASTSVKIPSLKDINKISDTAPVEDDPYIKGSDKEDFAFDEFLKLWNTHAAKIKAEGKMSLFTIFISEAPKMLSPYIFEVVVENKVQENLFKNEKPALLNYLRSSLKNFTIDVNPRVEEQVVSKRPYTSQEKFQYMAAKNPELIELRKRFNLDFD